MKLIEFNLGGVSTKREIVVSPRLEMMAAELQAAGFRFEAELSIEGDYHIECIRPEHTVGDSMWDFPIILAIQLGVKEDRIKDVVEKLIENSYRNYKQNYEESLTAI